MDAPSNVAYYTEMQRDRKLVTYAQGNCSSTRLIIWMTKARGPNDNQTYSLTVECKEQGGNLAIYADPSKTSKKRMWEAVTNTKVPTLRPIVSPVSNSPPDQTPNCFTAILMKSGDFLYPGNLVVDG